VPLFKQLHKERRDLTREIRLLQKYIRETKALKERVHEADASRAALRKQLVRLDEELEANKEKQKVLIEAAKKRSGVDLDPYTVNFTEITLEERIGAGAFGEVQ
jgi:chromosome segregation ATPase